MYDSHMNAATQTDTLHPKYKIFADEFLITGEKGKSAIKAGFAKNSAHVSATRLLKRPDVQQYLAQRAEKLSIQQDDLQTKVIRELEHMALTNIGDFIRINEDGKPVIDFSTAAPEQLKAIASVKNKTTRRYDKDGNHLSTDEDVAFSMADKYRGLELLGKHLGLFKEAEQRVVIDIADRLVNARRRVRELGSDDESFSDSQGGGGRGGV